MGDLEDHVSSALATTLEGVPWVAPYQRGTISLDEVPTQALMVGVAEIVLTVASLLPALAREVDEFRGGHDFGE
ncbi:MAG TPA: hypothetical protein VHT29_10835 [Solirubrobacteraceae bacterium]|jgi:hypothetical protein|nr:hypothetical protein [Solirubrobacteraceae bacterium]